MGPGGNAQPIPGVPTQPPPAPTFVPGKPGFVVTGTPDAPRAVPVAGLPGAGVDLDASQRAKAIQQYNYAKQLQDTADQLQQLYMRGPGATSGIQGLKDYLPSPDNKNFDTAANKSRGIVGQTLGFTGGQLNTPQESEKAVGPFIPTSGDFDSTILQKIQSMRDLAESGRQNAIQTLGGEPDANGNIAPAQPNSPQGNAQLPPDQVTLSGGGKTRDVVDPVLKATAGKIGQMFASGVPDADILKFMRDSNLDPAKSDIMEKLRFRATDPAFKAWLRQHPGEPYPIDPELYTKSVPMSATRSLLNAAAADNTAGALVAAPIASANALTGGYLNDIIGATGGSAQEAQNGLDLMRSQHPFASLAGDVAGYATAEGLAGLAPGLRGLKATAMGRRGMDALYGAYSGSGESDGNRVIGAIEGAGINTAGGMFGRGLQKGTGAALKGIRNADLSYLDKAGVPLTVGRIARGAGDFNPLNPATPGDEVGKGVAGIEDRLSRWPGLDAVIGTARQRGDQAFNQATFREIAPGVTGTGADGLISSKAAEKAAYAKIDPVRLAVDPDFESSLAAAGDAARGLNHHAGDVASVIADVRNQIADGGMTGKGYQTALQTIRKTRATLNDDVGGKAGAILTDLENSMAGLGQRQGGQVAQDLATANAIHGRREIVKTALKSPAAQGAGEMFSPKTLNQASIGNTSKYGGLDRALSSERPFYDLTSAGMKVMPNLTPDSGTAGNLLLYPALLGATGTGVGAAAGGDDRLSGAAYGGGVGTGLGALTLAAAAGPYSRGGQRLIQRALLSERPEAINVLGDVLKRHPKLAGMFGASMARDFFLQPELPQ
jgi:hypothetical protein